MSGILHPKCGRRFAQSHCGSCCQDFTGQGPFDEHRLGPHSKYAWTCLPSWTFPAIGLVLTSNGSWAGAGADPDGPTKRSERARERFARTKETS